MASPKRQIKSKPHCVVIDTNVRRSDLLLKTPVGAALVYTLHRQGGFIGLPEVIELELKDQMLEAGLQEVEKFKAASQKISMLTEWPTPIEPPTQSDIQKKVEQRLADLAPILVRAEFTIEHARAALKMVNAKLAPNGEKNQQFKDSAIWQAVLAYSKNYDVRLVTKDHGFFTDKDSSKGLAPNLLADSRRAGGNITAHDDLASCLTAITIQLPSFDRKTLVSLLINATIPRLRTEASKRSFEIGKLLTAEIQAYQTKQANWLAVDYTLRFALKPSELPDGRRDLRITTHGSCYYDPRVNSISAEFPWSIVSDWRTPGGEGRMARVFPIEDSSILFPPVFDSPWVRAESIEAI